MCTLWNGSSFAYAIICLHICSITSLLFFPRFKIHHNNYCALAVQAGRNAQGKSGACVLFIAPLMIACGIVLVSMLKLIPPYHTSTSNRSVYQNRYIGNRDVYAKGSLLMNIKIHIALHQC